MNSTAVWIVIALSAAFALPALLLAALEHARVLRAVRLPDGSSRPARALAAVEVFCGPLVAAGSVWLRARTESPGFALTGVMTGAGLCLLGGAEFVSVAAKRRWISRTGLGLLVIAVFIDRMLLR